MISIIMPTYNADATIYYSVRSILNQTYYDFELLVLDDGSTNETSKIINGINDKRIRYHFLPHQGLTNTLNYGLTIAKYDLIARMDDDDLCLPWRFERQLKEIHNHPENVLLSSWYAIFDNNKIQYTVETPIESEKIKKGFLLHSYISHPGLMCYKKTLIENGGYRNDVEIDAFQDYETWLKIKENVVFAVIPEVLLFQRFNSNSLSNNMLYKQKIMYAIQEPYYQDLEKYFKIKNKSEENIYRGWREYFYGRKSKARVLWLKLGSSITMHPRIFIAFIVTFLPDQILSRFKESRMKFRLKYLLHYHSSQMRKLRDSLDVLLKG